MINNKKVLFLLNKEVKSYMSFTKKEFTELENKKYNVLRR